MRQAGRYLPEYRAVRKNHSFSEMYKRPDLATEVTLQPIDILGVDAAILFSDILVVPEAMGMELHFSEGKGPQFPSPLRDEAALKALRPVESNQDLGFVMEAIRNIRQTLLRGLRPYCNLTAIPRLGQFLILGRLAHGQRFQQFQHILLSNTQKTLKMTVM